MALVLATAGFIVVTVTWGAYLVRIGRGTVPARPLGHGAAEATGIVLAIAGLARGLSTGSVIGPLTLAVPTLGLGALFFFLLSQRKTPVGDIRVQVGDRLPAFETVDSEGARFRTDSLAGQRVLFKFFRGHW